MERRKTGKALGGRREGYGRDSSRAKSDPDPEHKDKVRSVSTKNID